MEKINFQNGVTPVNADTFNTFQNNINQMQNEIGVIVSPTEPTGDNRRKVWMQHSNNIFNKMTSTKNQYIDDGGNYGQSDVSNLSDFIPIIPNTNYIAKGYGNTAQTKRIAFFDSSKAFISTKASLNDTNSTFYFKTLSNASYIRVQYFKDIEDSLDITIEPKIYVKNDNDIYEEFIRKDDNEETIDFKNEITFNEDYANAQFKKIGKLIVVNYQGENKSHSKNEILFKIPQKYCPSKFIPINFIGQDSAYSGVAGIQTTGNFQIISISNTTNPGRLYTNFTYILD